MPEPEVPLPLVELELEPPPWELELPLEFCEPEFPLELLPMPLPEFPDPPELVPEPDPAPPCFELQPATIKAVANTNNARFIFEFSFGKPRLHCRCGLDASSVPNGFRNTTGSTEVQKSVRLRIVRRLGLGNRLQHWKA